MSIETGEYLLWRSGERSFGLELPHCREIVNSVAITRLSRAPMFVLGLANLRGSVISVIDLEILLGYKKTAAYRSEANLIRLRTDGYPIAVAADKISDTVFLTEAELERAPANLSEGENNFIRLVAKLPDGIVLIPDLHSIAAKIQ
jgi:purine-binding chemotaxis protein CheW